MRTLSLSTFVFLTFLCASVNATTMTFGNVGYSQPNSGFSYSENGYTVRTSGDKFNYANPAKWVPSNSDFTDSYFETWNSNVVFTFTNDLDELFDFTGADLGYVLNNPGSWTIEGFNGSTQVAAITVDTAVTSSLELSDLSDFTSLTALEFQKAGGVFSAFDNITFSLSSNGTSAPVPEPSTMLLLGFGLIGITGAARRKLN